MKIILIQYQPTIALGLLKGKMGGTVFQQGNNIAVIRMKGYRKGSNSASRAVATSNLQAVSTSWSLLTPTERATWKTLALSYPFINKFGVTYYGSAYQVYQAVNIINLILDIAINTSAPVNAAPTNLSPVVFSTLSNTHFDVQYAGTAGDGTLCMVYATAGMSPGRNLNNPKTRFIGILDCSVASPINMIAQYTAVYGTPLKTQQIIMKTFFIQPSYPFFYFKSVTSAIVA
jgi:hypothetical protein